MDARVEYCFFFSSRRRHTRWTGDWSSDVCSSDLLDLAQEDGGVVELGLCVVSRRWCLFEQPQRLLDQREPCGGLIDRPAIGGALADDRGSGMVWVIGEPAV